MIQRWEKMIAWGAFPAALLIAYLVSWVARYAWAKGPADSLLYAILSFIFVHLAVALLLNSRIPKAKEAATSLVRSHQVDHESRLKPVEKHLRIQLCKDAAEALQAIMLVESNHQPPSAIINDLLISHQRALRNKLLCKW